MRANNKSHKCYCCIDLHTKMMSVCLMNSKGNILIHMNIPTNGGTFLRLIKKYRKGIAVGVECMFRGAKRNTGSRRATTTTGNAEDEKHIAAELIVDVAP